MKRAPVLLLVLSLAAGGGRAMAQEDRGIARPQPTASRARGPIELALRSGGSSTVDLRNLPRQAPRRHKQLHRPAPALAPLELPGRSAAPRLQEAAPGSSLAAPAPTLTFDGLDRFTWGADTPPDANGDAGPTVYIQAVNASVGIFDKTNGSQITAFTFDTLMSQGAFGNPCDSENMGDPIVLYDTFEDRWVLTDSAFTLDVGGNVVPPVAFQCFAVSKTGDPVSGGWNFYSLQIDDLLNVDPRLGIWIDGIYMSANMHKFAAGGQFQTTRVWAFNKAQMYAGALTVQVVSFDKSSDSNLLPSNARLQTGTPPLDTPNYFLSTSSFTNALTIYKFRADWDRISLSTFNLTQIAVASGFWPNTEMDDAQQPFPGAPLEVVQWRAMMQNQYTNYAGIESLWATHTVRRENMFGFAAPRWYQADVTGGSVDSSLPQSVTWDPDGANTFDRFIPSLALDRGGNLALGYSTTSESEVPSIKYAGRLATDPINTFGQTEQVLFAGTAVQSGSRLWGRYSAMTLDPDGCTFWYTNEYANPASQDLAKLWLTRIGKFKYAECTPFAADGTISGTVTATVGGAPIVGAILTLGSRSTTTNGTGFYSLAVPAGTYLSLVAAAAGYTSASAANVVVADGGTTTQNFTLDLAPTSACLTDTTRLDFLRGLQTTVDVDTVPDDIKLFRPSLDQSNTNIGSLGTSFNATTWAGQTFTAAATGLLTGAEINLFCSSCSGTTPDLTLSVRATSAGLPTGADLATATIPGFNSASSSYVSVTFTTPPSVTAGTKYALVIRPTANPSPGTYALTRSGNSSTGNDVYLDGTRVSSSSSGLFWSIPQTGGVTTDAGFRTFVDRGFSPSGSQVSALFDSNPLPPQSSTWATLSWTAATPTSTTVSFQVAGSTSINGPFDFVGPDGTPGTFFTVSGASLNPLLNNKRYLKYKAILGTTDGTQTPTLNDVTVCFQDVVEPPELALTKSDGGASVAPGGTVAYTLSYGDNSGLGATGVVLTEAVPANTTFNAGASTAGWGCTPNNNAGSTCTLAIGALVGNSGVQTATFAVTVATPVAAGVSQISNTASIADDGANGVDPVPGNNAGSDTTPVTAAPDLTLTKSDGGASAMPGDTVAYTLTYANAGNQGATGVVLTETVPASSTFNSGASTAGWGCTPDNSAGSTCTLAIGGLAGSSGNLTATFAVTVDNPANGVSQISNTASIADDAGNGTDPNPGDNSASDATPVGARLYYYTVEPCRLFDTRNPSGPYGGPSLQANLERTFTAAGQCGVPSGAKAVSINVTVINATATGFLTIYPAGISQPLTSVINFSANQTRANNAIVSLDANGDLVVLCGQSSGTADGIVDINGYFLEP